jgi:hypothetical protein
MATFPATSFPRKLRLAIVRTGSDSFAVDPAYRLLGRFIRHFIQSGGEAPSRGPEQRV